MDYSGFLNGPFDEEKRGSDLVLESPLDLTIVKDTSVAASEHYCCNRAASVAQVAPVFLDISSKFRVPAIKELNPTHEGDKSRVYNPQWQRLIFGRDLHTKTVGNLLTGINVKARLQDWDMKLASSRFVCIQALVYRRSLPLHLMPRYWEAWGPEKTKEWEKKYNGFLDSMNDFPQLEDVPRSQRLFHEDSRRQSSNGLGPSRRKSRHTMDMTAIMSKSAAKRSFAMQHIDAAMSIFTKKAGTGSCRRDSWRSAKQGGN